MTHHYRPSKTPRSTTIRIANHLESPKKPYQTHQTTTTEPPNITTSHQTHKIYQNLPTQTKINHRRASQKTTKRTKSTKTHRSKPQSKSRQHKINKPQNQAVLIRSWRTHRGSSTDLHERDIGNGAKSWILCRAEEKPKNPPPIYTCQTMLPPHRSIQPTHSHPNSKPLTRTIHSHPKL